MAERYLNSISQEDRLPDEADNSEDLLFIHNGVRHCGYKKEILLEDVDAFTEKMITCMRCKGIQREPCGVGVPLNVICTACCDGETPIPMAMMFGEINVRCPLRLRPNTRCNWEGHLQNVKQHLDECVMFIIDCELLCGRTMPRDEYQEHSENDCDMREVQCEHCGENFLFKDIATHHDNCNRYPIECCNNECEQVVPRDELDNHLMICDFTQIYCEYARYGCHQMLQVKDKVQHNEEFQLLHLQQKMSYVVRQVTEMEKKINQYDALAGYHLCFKGLLDIRGTGETISSRTFTVPPSTIVFRATSSILDGSVNIGINFRSSRNIAFDFWTILYDRRDNNLSSLNKRQKVRVCNINFTAIPVAWSYEYALAQFDLAMLINANTIILNNILKIHIFALQI